MFVWCLFGVCWVGSWNLQLVGNDQVQVKEKSKIETSFLYTFGSFQIQVSQILILIPYVHVMAMLKGGHSVVPVNTGTQPMSLRIS